MQNSAISWTDHTFNPWLGCTKVSPGCAHCYAETWAKRSNLVTWGEGQPRKRTSPANWKQPIIWNQQAKDTIARIKADIGNASEYNDIDYSRPRVFCASLADWLDDEVPVEWLADLLNLIRITPHLDWLLLTKRPENFAERMADVVGLSCVTGCGQNDPYGMAGWMASTWASGKVIPHNIWIGTSVEDQARAEQRIKPLLEIPANIRFLSCEPLLEPVDLDFGAPRHRTAASYHARIHWVIVGGESGPMHRPFHPDWARGIRDQCAASGIAFHMKQMGGLRPSTMPPIPADLMIQDFPSP